jgi:hypothetical protein
MMTTNAKGYKLHSLLTRHGDTVRGPMSPMYDKMALDKEEGFTSNMLLRVHFDNEHMLQVCECGCEWTGLDCLVLGWINSNGSGYVAMYSGTANMKIMPIGMLLSEENGPEQPVITPIYRRKLASATVREPDTYWKRNMPSEEMIGEILRDALALAPTCAMFTRPVTA